MTIVSTATPEVQVKPVGIILTPTLRYQTKGASGVDLYAALEESVEIQPGKWTLIPTGIAIALPEGYEGQVRPRSGLALKAGITVSNSPGSLDRDYRGEVGVILINHSDVSVFIKPLDRIAQLVIAPVTRATFKVVDSLDETERGAGGFGSTGVSG